MKFKMKKFGEIKKNNVGQKDRVARVVVAALLLLGFYNGGFHNWVSALIAVGLLASAYFRFCPAYALFDKDTNEPQPPAAG